MVEGVGEGMNCPLSNEKQMAALDEPLKTLITQCRAKECCFVDSEHDSDYLPANCVLLVVAMLNPRKKSKHV